MAIVGARNGHDFARFAMQNGAAAVLASEKLDTDIPAIYVDDTVKALQDIASGYRSVLSCACIGITGSVGKTTTKEMVASVLQTAFRTQKTAANFNNDIGLPVTVLSLKADCECAVLEMGMNHFGEISVLTKIARPNIAVITNVGTMHIENLGSREGILKAKLEILEGLADGARVVFCGDNDLLHTVAQQYGAVEYGLQEHNQVRAINVKTQENETRFTALAFDERFDIVLPAVGEHNVLNALCAITVGLLSGVPVQKIQSGLADFRNTGMRQNMYEKNGISIIADCYNAGPESMRAALQVLSNAKGRRIAVLGGMLELGDYAQQAHYEVGLLTAQNAQMLFAYGANTDAYVEGAKKLKMAYAERFETHEALAKALADELQPGDTVLLKGSRGMRMERILELLNLHSEGDK